MGWRLSTFHSCYNLLELLQVRHSLQILAIWFFNHRILHILHILHMTGTINQTKHPQRIITQQVTCSLYSSGSWSGRHTHIRTIHRLQASLHLRLFAAPPAYYQAGVGGASPWTHAATVETRWSERHAYPVTVRWLCSYAWCIRKKIIYLLLLMDIWAFAQWHLMFIEYYYWIFE